MIVSCLADWIVISCCCVSDGSVIRDHIGNIGVTAADETSPLLTDSVMQVSYTDSDKSPTESTYDLPIDSSNSLPSVRLASALHMLSFLFLNLTMVRNHMQCSLSSKFYDHLLIGSQKNVMCTSLSIT